MADHEWKNKSTSCKDDKWQVFFNNSKGDEKKDVFFTIVNKGNCPVTVGTSPTREGLPLAKQTDNYPKGTDERAIFPVPKGHYLMATCATIEASGCEWTISEVKP